MFSSSAKLSSTSRTEPRNGVFGAKLQAAKTSGNVTPAFDVDLSNVPEDDLPPLQTLTTPRKKRTITTRKTEPFIPAPSGTGTVVPPSIQRDQRATVEDDEDEADAVSSTSKKKKKKKTKKKRTEFDELATVQEDATVNTENTTLRPLSKVPSKSPPTKLPSSNASMTSLAQTSTTSLPIAPIAAKSGHAYLQELGPQKEKIKSRPDHGSASLEKKGFLSKLSGKDKEKQSAQRELEGDTDKKPSAFSKLRKKTMGYMQRLLHLGDEKGGLKWENFLKVHCDYLLSNGITYYTALS